MLLTLAQGTRRTNRRLVIQSIPISRSIYRLLNCTAMHHLHFFLHIINYSFLLKKYIRIPPIYKKPLRRYKDRRFGS